MAKFADGVIVGSAFVQRLLAAPDLTAGVAAVRDLATELAAGVGVPGRVPVTVRVLAPVTEPVTSAGSSPRYSPRSFPRELTLPNWPVAYLPSPARGAWHPGPLPVRGYALCIALGIIVAVWLTVRRYARAGGAGDTILDVAAWAVPFGLIGAAAGAVAGEGTRLIPSHPGLWSAARAWDGAIGVPGAVGLGALGAWIACRRAGVRLGPVAGAAAPGLAFGAAIASLGSWFSQQTYGRPSALPWAVEIAPVHRRPGV